MDFTREPIVQTVITPREGHKIVVRSSKNVSQEEYFVDSVELVSFGEGLFFRSKERPKPFLVPSSDYEVIEVREAKMVLKNVGLERSIKIAGGKEPVPRPQREEPKEVESSSPVVADGKASDQKGGERKRDRRRDKRRRHRSPDEAAGADESSYVESAVSEKEMHVAPPHLASEEESESLPSVQGPLLSALLTSPPPLISETLRSYRENALFKDAFYSKEEIEEGSQGEIESPVVPPPEAAAFETYTEVSQVLALPPDEKQTPTD